MSPVTSLIQIAKGLAALAAGHSPRTIARGGFAALRVLGPRGLMRRAAAAVTQQEDDERYRHWREAAPAPPSRMAVTIDAGAPLVSIITPVFNTHPAWLERCIASVRAQTYPRWELILSDDGSTAAGTLDVLRAASSSGADSRVQVIRAAANGGIVAASNAALELSLIHI